MVRSRHPDIFSDAVNMTFRSMEELPVHKFKNVLNNIKTLVQLELKVEKTPHPIPITR